MRRAARAVIVGVVLFGTTGCTRTPTAPGPEPPFAGTWLGQLRQLSCSHWDFRTCGRSYPANSTFTMLLELQQAGSLVSGTFDLEMLPPPGALAGPRHDSGTVTGAAGTADNVLLSGATFSDGQRVFDVREWESRISGGAMTGRFTLVRESQSPWESAPLVLEYEMLGLIRLAR